MGHLGSSGLRMWPLVMVVMTSVMTMNEDIAWVINGCGPELGSIFISFFDSFSEGECMCTQVISPQSTSRPFIGSFALTTHP